MDHERPLTVDLALSEDRGLEESGWTHIQILETLTHDLIAFVDRRDSVERILGLGGSSHIRL
jgi:hypothetical protein